MSKSENPRVRAAIVGIRHPHSLPYQELLSHIPEIDIVGIGDMAAQASRQRDEAQEIDPAARWGKPGTVVDRLQNVRIHTTLESLLAVPFEAAFVLLPNRDVPDVVERLASSGRHIFCEKPVARSVAEMQAVVRAVSDGGVAFATGYTWRQDPAAREVRRWIADGMLGKLQSIEARMVTSSVRARDPGHFLFDKSVSGGGILSWLGCHWIDLIRYVTNAEIRRVSALVAKTGTVDIDVEDTASVSLAFADGTVGTLHAAYVLDAGYETYLGIRGELGWIRWLPQEGTLHVKSLHPDWRGAAERRLQFTKDAYSGYGIDALHAIREFLKTIRGETAGPIADEKEALKTLEIIEAAYTSSQLGRHVSLQP